MKPTLRWLNLYSIIILAIGLAFWSSRLEAGDDELAVAANSPINNYHLGEDGRRYPLQSVEDKSSWQYGKIHPDLSTVPFDQEEFAIIIYLKNPPIHKIARRIKAERLPEVETLSGQVKAIVNQPIPQRNFETREEEKVLIESLTYSEEQTREVLTLNREIDSRIDAMKKEISRQARAEVMDAQQEIIDLIQQLGGTVGDISALANSIGAVFPAYEDFILEELARSPLVDSITPDFVYELDLDQSACMLGVGTWWNASTPIDGGAYDAALVDSGIKEDHVYLKYRDPPSSDPRNIYKRYDADVDTHGTRTAGVMASTHSTYRGMAFGLDAIFNASGDNNMSESDVMGNMDWVIDSPESTDSPEVINNSYSLYYNLSEYGQFERFMDAVVDDLWISVTKSAGNRSPDTAYDPPQLGYPQSHNLMSVANLDINNTCSTTDDVIRASSSRGPTDSNRRKPDITAPGQNTWSTDSASTTAFANHGGTSAAAPHVAGAVVLMEDGGNHNPMAIKAVLINSADTWSDNDTLLNYTDDGPVDGDHWDPTYGWGVMDLSHAHTHRNDFFSGSIIGRNDTAVDDDYKLYKGHMYTNDKVTMVWHRRAVYNDASAPSTYYTLSDLNLRLYDESTNSLIDSDLDGNDNVHQVSSNSSRDVVVKAYSWSTSISGATSEDYILATEENFAAASPPSFQRNYSRPNYVGPYQSFDIIARIFNNGTVNAHNNTITLQNIDGVTVSGINSHTLPTIVPGPYPNNPQETTYTLVTSGLAAGTHWLPLDFESNCYAETYTYSTSQGVSIIVETTPPTSNSSSPAYANGNIPVSWTASDTQTGVKRTFLWIKRPGDAKFYTPGVDVSTGTSGTFNYAPTAADGIYYFATRSEDNGGNWEAVPTAAETSTFLDRATPASSVSTPTYDTGGTIPLSFGVSDPAPSSGLEFVDFWYKKGSGGTWTYTGLFSNSTGGTVYFTPPAGDGIYYFASRAKDKAQNIEINASGSGDDSTIYDRVSPTGTISINGGAAATASLLVTLNLSAFDATSGMDRMRFSNNGTTWTGWEIYTSTKNNWNLSSYGGNSSQGTKRVYVQYRDIAGNRSTVYSDTIIYTLVPLCEGNFNPDTDVDGEDLEAFLTAFAANAPAADLNMDGVVDTDDVGVFAEDFGRTDCP